MEIVRAFNDNNLHTEIIIKGTKSDPLFRASDIGVILEISAIRSVIRDFNENEKVVHTMHTLGGSQEVSFLTEKGLYKVLFKSRKPIAEKFQNWVCEVIKEIRLNGLYDLQKEVEKQKLHLSELKDKNKQEYETQLSKQKLLEREKILLNQFATIGSIVYIIKVKSFENGCYIIKIGESRKGITDRYKEHKSKYEECLLMDCFSVHKSKDFESFLHNHDLIRNNKVNDLLGHEKELELFYIGKNLSYSSLLTLINSNLSSYQYNVNELLSENLQLKLQIESGNSCLNISLLEELIKNVKIMSNKIDYLEKINKEFLEKDNLSPTKLVTGFNESLITLGPRVQKINPETLQLIQVYDSVSEVLRENPLMKRPSIQKAVVENTVYHQFRWFLVDRDLDPTLLTSISPTKLTKAQNLGYIAKLNKEKTEILNVYLDRKTAAKYNGYESNSALDNPVKKGSISKGFYYMLYDDCDEICRQKLEEKINGAPILFKNGIGQLDLQNNLVKEFICKYDCIKQLKISDKTLTKALDKNISYQGFYYKNLEPKLKIF